MFFTRANRLAKKQRHMRLKDIGATYNKAKFISSNSERNFFKSVVALSTTLFILSFVLPSIFTTEASFWIPQTEAAETLATTTPFAEEGFFIKPEIQTKYGNREHINEIIEIKVEEGDTIYSIAQKYGISTQTITQNNNIYNANRLKKGQS